MPLAIAKPRLTGGDSAELMTATFICIAGILIEVIVTLVRRLSTTYMARNTGTSDDFTASHQSCTRHSIHRQARSSHIIAGALLHIDDDSTA